MSPDTPDQPRRLQRPDYAADAVDAGPEPYRGGPSTWRDDPPRRTPGPRPAPVRGRKRAPLVVAAAVATSWAALLSYLPVVLVLAVVRWSGDDHGIGGAFRFGLAGWLLGHRVPLETVAGPLGLPPLAIGSLAAWRLIRAGVHVTRAVGARHDGTVRQVTSIAGAVGVAYGMLGALAASLVSGGSLAASPARAGLTFALLGALAALTGALASSGILPALAGRLPVVVRDGIRTGLVAALLLLGAGAGAAGLAVATGGGEASDMISAYRTGVAGQAGITLISAGYAPNAAIWAVSYLLGPGFLVGTGTVVRTSEVTVGALPAVPLFVGLPNGPVDGIGTGLLAVPIVAGMTAGWLLARRTLRTAGRDRTSAGWAPLLLAAALGGPVAGGGLGLAAAWSGGSLGGGRLAEMGPVSWQVAAVATLVIAVSAVVGAAATRAARTGPGGGPGKIRTTSGRRPDGAGRPAGRGAPPVGGAPRPR